MDIGITEFCRRYIKSKIYFYKKIHSAENLGTASVIITVWIDFYKKEDIKLDVNLSTVIVRVERMDAV